MAGQIFFFLFFLFGVCSSLPSTPEELIQRYNYPCETHNIPTSDGYLINTQRIPRPNAPVVWLQHGLLDSAATWLINRPDESLGFLLYDSGFDVWIGNQRGNRFSDTMQGGKPMNFSFSIDEMAQYDDEAILTYVTNATGKSRVSWIGHSRGTQQMFYGLSRYPHHADYLNLFVALGPVVWTAHCRTMLLSTIANIDTDDLLDRLGWHDFLPSIGQVDLLCTFCGPCCTDVISAIVGPGQNNATAFNQSLYELITHFTPAGTSSQEMAHYAQLVKTGLAQMYDYGAAKNKVIYGRSTPPLYDVSKIPTSVPIAMYWGGQDYLADPTDVQNALKALGSRVIVNHYEPDWNHMEFTWGLLPKLKVYPEIIGLLKKYNSF